MRKHIIDFRAVSVEHIHERYVLLRLTSEECLPEMLPGQFVEVRIDGSPTTFLRRPISICFVDRQLNELWLLIATIGDGTRWLGSLAAGDIVNCVLPLGNGFTLPSGDCAAANDGMAAASGDSVAANSLLLVGGGVGVAPLLYLGSVLRERGVVPTFLLGARSAGDLLLLSEFEKYGRVLVTTEDGSAGERGFVTQHSVLGRERFDAICTCGPTPMMKAVAAYARKTDTPCEASLENMMACGLGACLCCVEKTTEGNLCVCKDGPVFNINRLLWQD
jgi:dihydroorotate dehydrogenase electron transfer subunit